MLSLDDIRTAVAAGKALTAAQARILHSALNAAEIQHLRDETRMSHYSNETMKAAARAVALEIAAQAVIDRYADGGIGAIQPVLYRLQEAIDAKRDPIPLADMVASVACYRIAVTHGGTPEAIAAAQAAMFAANLALYKPDAAREVGAT